MNREHDVVIAGGGPTGLMLAAELALAKVDVAVVEKRANADLIGSRAGGLHARTIEVFDQRGVAERFLAEGQKMQVAGFAMTPLDISDFPTRHNYGLALWQKHIERILAGWVSELPVTFYREREVTGFSQDDAGVEVNVSDGTTLRAKHLVGCDGGRSVVRKTAGIEFAGWDATTSWLIAEVEMTEPQLGPKTDANGLHGLTPLQPGGPIRVLLTEATVGGRDEPTLDDLRAALKTVYGTDFEARNPISLSRFTDLSRQATKYRVGRVLLAGDAAHVHAPAGGQGLNIGVQDAVNLGWKLARVAKGTSPEGLLDTYFSERHPVGAKVLQTSMAQIALRKNDARIRAINDTVTELLTMAEPRKRYAGLMSGLELRYDVGGVDHPLVGRRMPDLDLVTSAGPRRVFSFLHQAQPLFLRFSGTAEARGMPTVDATFSGPWALPVIGDVAAPTAVLVRPDGYVAWVGLGSDAGLADAEAKWFG